MFAGLWNLVTLAVTAVVGIGLFGFAREYVRKRLRFVDAVRHPLAPWMAGAAVLMIGTPVAALLPFVTGFTALVAGAAVGLGTASGVKAIRSGD